MCKPSCHQAHPAATGTTLPPPGIYAERSQLGISGVAAGDLSQVRGGLIRLPSCATKALHARAVLWPKPAGSLPRVRLYPSRLPSAGPSLHPWVVSFKALVTYPSTPLRYRRARCGSSTATALGRRESWSARWRCRGLGRPQPAGDKTWHLDLIFSVGWRLAVTLDLT